LRRLVVIALLAALAALAAPSTAGARALDPTAIVPGRAIGKASVLAARANIEERIGPGRLVKRVRTDFGRLSTYRYATGVDVTFRSGVAVAVLTKSARFETASGVGVGSTKAKLRRTYPGLQCPSATLCTVGRLVPGARVTDFRFAKGRTKVVSVLVGVVLD
jgi:hypothetical protein